MNSGIGRRVKQRSISSRTRSVRSDGGLPKQLSRRAYGTLLRSSRQGFYASQSRPMSQRARDDVAYARDIKRGSLASNGTYGSPRIWRTLREEGKPIGENRTRRIMRENDIRGCIRPRFRNRNLSPESEVASNVLNREFDADAPNKKWAVDITYLWTSEGWSYHCAVIDLYSRSVVGWSLAKKQNTAMVTAAIMMAITRRGRYPGLIIHSDQGSQFTSKKYQRLLRKLDVECSMSRRGNCWDYSCVESFFGTLKQELYFRQNWKSHSQLRAALYNYIEVFYNRQRMHSTLGFVSPFQFEQNAN